MISDTQPTFVVSSPFDRTPIATFPYTERNEAIAALERAWQRHRDRAAWFPAGQRMAVLERFASLVHDRADELARQAAQEGGKPIADSKIEIERAVEGVHAAIREIPQLRGAEIPMGLNGASANRFAHTYREPRGVVLAVSAFNHPFNLIIHQAVTAVAAGCPVLVKPALATPMSALAVVDMLEEAGLPEGWCQPLLTSNDVTGELVGDPRVAFLTFIGSARVGWHLRSRLAPGAACALEHGGVAPVIVDATADIEAAVPLLVRGGFYHAGQVCVSVQRVYVHRSVSQALIDGLKEAASHLRTGDPLDETTDIGPLISPAEVDRVDAWVHEASEAGGQILCGGRKLSETTYAPTIVLDPPDDVRLSREEAFGPVVAVYAYDDIDDAIARANGPDVFFQASVFTQNLDTALSVSRRLHGMAVMVNDHSAFRVDWMPFGGHRQSGLGAGGIGSTMREMTLERMVVFRSARL